MHEQIHEQIHELIALRTIDEALYRDEREAAALPERRAQLEAETTEAEARAATRREEMLAAEERRRTLEAQVQDKETLKSKLELQKYELKSNDAYRLMEEEIDSLGEAIDALETELIEAMDVVDAAHDALEAAEKQRDEVRARAAKALDALEARAQELAASAEKQRARRAEQCERVDGTLLVRYEKVLKHRRPAVVEVRGETCTGCQVSIPPQRYVDLLEGRDVVACQQCQRILISPRAPQPG